VLLASPADPLTLRVAAPKKTAISQQGIRFLCPR
jgi:hypothetical protein